MSDFINVVCGPVPIVHSSIKTNFYGLHRRKAAEYALSIGRELAEGPTVFLAYNANRFYSPAMELWPLVMEG